MSVRSSLWPEIFCLYAGGRNPRSGVVGPSKPVMLSTLPDNSVPAGGTPVGGGKCIAHGLGRQPGLRLADRGTTVSAPPASLGPDARVRQSGHGPEPRRSSLCRRDLTITPTKILRPQCMPRKERKTPKISPATAMHTADAVVPVASRESTPLLTGRSPCSTTARPGRRRSNSARLTVLKFG